MGYYTNHNLKIYQIDNEEIDNDESLKKKLEDEINKYILNDLNLEYAVGSITEDWPCDVAKWYYHQEDMIELSRHFPDVVFELEGIGEETGDMWKEYYKNGLYQDCTAIITYPEYDPNKLKTRRHE